ncbi:MAG: chromosome segregation ATPase [Bermanella sp.]|jgi:chromosome segregation ATPase
MSKPEQPSGVNLDADDIESFKRERSTRMVDRIGGVPDVAGDGGGSAGWLAWLIILVLLGGGYYLYQQLDVARAQLTLDQQRILRLEKQLNITDESVTESSDQMQKQVQFLDAEIRKLWDNVWKKSKEQLNEHEERLGKFETSLQSLKTQIAAADQAAVKDRRELAALKVQQQKTQSMAETNWSEIAELREGADVAAQVAKLETRIKANEEWLESINSFRKQVNRDINRLRESLSANHPSSTGAPAP